MQPREIRQQSKYFEETKKIIQEVKGSLAGIEGEYLFKLARNCQGKGVIVEIGSLEGKSTIWLARGSKAGNKVKVYAIDPFDGGNSADLPKPINTFKEFKENIKKAKVKNIVIPIVSRSQDIAKNFNKSIELLFIDGSHLYEFVSQDFKLYFPKIIAGGIIAFHDSLYSSSFKGIIRLMKELSKKSKILKKIDVIHTITSWRKI